MKRLVLGGAAAAVVAVVFVLDPPIVQTLLVLLAAAFAAIPWLARPLRRMVDALGRRVTETPSRLRTLDSWDRVVLLCATAASGAMAVSAFGPWLDYGSPGWGGGFDLPRGAAFAGGIVVLAGLVGIALVLLTAPSGLGGAWALVAGTVGVAAILDVRDAIGDACPWLHTWYEVLAICVRPEVGWGLQLAILASLALCSIGLAWLVVAGVRALRGRQTAAPI